MPYPKPEEWQFTLEPIGAPELWVRCIDPRSVSARAQRRVHQAILILQRLERGKPIEPNEEWALSAMDELMREVIVEWNLPYPESDRIIPLDGDDPFGPLPGDVYEFLTREIGGRLLRPSKRARG